MPLSEPRPQDIHTEDLRVLLAVHRTGRLTSAAALLGIDHTTVRRRLDRLETTLQVRLLDRGAESWELTAVGRAVVEQAGPLERLVEQVLGAASSTGFAPRGPVQVITPDGFSVAFASRAIGRVRSEYPGITVDLVTSTRPLSSRAAGFDIAVSIGAPSPLRISSSKLSDYSLHLFASPEYLDRHPAIEALDDLGAHALVFYVDALLTVRDLDLAPLLSGMKQGFGSTNVFAQVEATQSGAGIGLLPDFLAVRAPDLVRVLPREVSFELAFHMAARTSGTANDAVEIVRQALIRETRERASELMPTIGAR